MTLAILAASVALDSLTFVPVHLAGVEVNPAVLALGAPASLALRWTAVITVVICGWAAVRYAKPHAVERHARTLRRAMLVAAALSTYAAWTNVSW